MICWYLFYILLSNRNLYSQSSKFNTKNVTGTCSQKPHVGSSFYMSNQRRSPPPPLLYLPSPSPTSCLHEVAPPTTTATLTTTAARSRRRIKDRPLLSHSHPRTLIPVTPVNSPWLQDCSQVGYCAMLTSALQRLRDSNHQLKQQVRHR
jgi:hypothetical protein